MAIGQRRPITSSEETETILPQQQITDDQLLDSNQQREHDKPLSHLNRIKQHMLDPTRRIKNFLLFLLSIGLIIFHQNRELSIIEDNLSMPITKEVELPYASWCPNIDK